MDNFHEENSDQPLTPPIDLARVRQVLTNRMIAHEIADGDRLKLTDQVVPISITVNDADVLSLWADEDDVFDVERIDEVRAMITTWHREHYWPTASFGISDHGRIRVRAGVAYDFEAGVTDYQLDDVIAMSMAKTNEFFRKIHQL